MIRFFTFIITGVMKVLLLIVLSIFVVSYSTTAWAEVKDVHFPKFVETVESHISNMDMDLESIASRYCNRNHID